jgi:predicted ATPase
LKVVLTGAPHSGKTSLVDELARRGHRVVHEAAIGIIDELLEEHGSPGAQIWRRTHVREFQERIAQRQLALERAAHADAATLCFCDRGLVDGLVYFELGGVEPSQSVLDAVAHSRYDLAILCELVLPFSPRLETGRTSDLQRACDIEALLERTYARYGYEFLRLPAILPVAARADRLLELLAARTARR